MKKFSIIGAFFLFAACSGETVTTRTIKNNSDKDLKMVLYRGGASGDTMTIGTGQSHQISISTQSTGSDEDPDCVWEIDSAYTEVVGGGQMVKKIQFSGNWDSDTDKIKTVPREYENTCTFNIYNTDIK